MKTLWRTQKHLKLELSFVNNTAFILSSTKNTIVDNQSYASTKSQFLTFKKFICPSIHIILRLFNSRMYTFFLHSSLGENNLIRQKSDVFITLLRSFFCFDNALIWTVLVWFMLVLFRYTCGFSATITFYYRFTQKGRKLLE